MGQTYEEARALGGRFGRSNLFQLTPQGPDDPPAPLYDLESFSLEIGLPEFTTGRLTVARTEEDGRVIWTLEGAPGFRYLVEKALIEFTWEPLIVVTNVSGRVEFVDPAPPDQLQGFYRSRMLD